MRISEEYGISIADLKKALKYNGNSIHERFHELSEMPKYKQRFNFIFQTKKPEEVQQRIAYLIKFDNIPDFNVNVYFKAVKELDDIFNKANHDVAFDTLYVLRNISKSRRKLKKIIDTLN